MAAMLASPHLIDLILVFTIVEAVFLGVLRRRLFLSRAEARGGGGYSYSTDRHRGGGDPAISANGGDRMGPAVKRRDGGGSARRPVAILLLLLPGIFLLLAVRAALADAAWPWVPAALTASLVAHLLDLRERWRP